LINLLVISTMLTSEPKQAIGRHGQIVELKIGGAQFLFVVWAGFHFFS
jgi:hypothetical protein